jgi:hypothetical protein
VAALMPARLLLPSRLTRTPAEPPLLLNSNALALKTSAHAPCSVLVLLASTGAGVCVGADDGAAAVVAVGVACVSD